MFFLHDVDPYHDILQSLKGSHVRGNSTSTSEDSRTPVSQKKALVPSGKKQSSYDEVTLGRYICLRLEAV